MTTEKTRQGLPWGLNPEKITPGSMKTISKEKLKAFSVGNMNSIKQKSSVMRKKEEQEEKKRLEEQKQARVYEEFVRDFEQNAPRAKKFVKGDVINAESSSSDKGKVYNPEGMRRMEELTRERISAPKQERTKKKAKEPEKKKSNLELFKEELKQQQAEREERHRLKKLGIISATAPDTVSTGLSVAPGMRDQLDRGTSPDDPHSTNLYVGNLAMSIKEEQFCKIFGVHGPLASVKIMWPRSEDERGRSSNCGFVAYMCREHAEVAQEELNGKEVEGFTLRVGWGASVPIPPTPFYVPPHMANETALAAAKITGLPFSAIPKKIGVRGPIMLPPNRHDANELLRECIVYVSPPTDKETLARINRTAQFVIAEGSMFEAMIMNKELNNPKFQFLFDNMSREHCYYRWRLYSLLQGETFSSWKTEEFRMFKNGSMWCPPPLPRAPSSVKKKEVEKQTKGQLTNPQRDKLEDMLRGLTVEKELVGDCMFWCMQHADAAEEIVECIGESLSILQTPPTVKAARLFLCNDLLYNSCAEVPNASSFRTKLEARLGDIVVNLKATLSEIKSYQNKEKFRSQVHACFRAWKMWNLYSVDYLAKLEAIFSAGSKLVAEEEEEDEVDGMPLDVDGIPLAKDVDGEPLQDSVTDMFQEKIIEEDDDIFTVPEIKSKWSEPSSKWSEPAPSTPSSATPSSAPSLGSKWESSKWESGGGLESKRDKEIEAKVGEYMEKMEKGKCTRIQRITTMEQTELYRKLLYKGLDARRIIKQVASGKRSLPELHSELKKIPTPAPKSSSTSTAQSKTSSAGTPSSSSSSLVRYEDSGDSRSPSPELKRKRDHSERPSSPKSEKKRKSRY